jgi:tRNA G18 (ribose-2'-O)-methylase SpoU
MPVFLYAPQDHRNLCVLARTLEVFGERECFVFDPHRLIRERYGKARTREQRVVSAGAFENIVWTRVEDPAAFLSEPGRRVVATVADAGARPIAEHRFTASDVLLFGPEGSGLPADIVSASAAAVTIPSYGRTQSLNLAVALGIVLFEWHRQTSVAPGTST